MISAQREDPELRAISDCLASGINCGDHKLSGDGGIIVQGRLIVPQQTKLRNEFMA